MLISPECYYENNLKGKSKEEIMTSIRGLKQKIGSLKNEMENPDALVRVAMSPSEELKSIFIVSSWKKLSKPMLKRVELMFYQGRKKRLISLLETWIPFVRYHLL